MNTQRKILAGLVLAVAALSVAGVKVSRLPRTTTNFSNDLVNIVRTVDGKRTNYAEELHNLARGIGPWITNSGSGGTTGNGLTNNDTRAIQFASSLRVEGRTTNAEAAYFQQDIVQAAGQAADLGNVSAKIIDLNGTNVAAVLHSIGTNITYTSNELYSLIIAAGISANTATNISRYFATNSAIITSNALWSALAQKSNGTLYGTVTVDGATANEVAAFNASKQLVPVPGVSSTELGFIDGLTENVQGKLDELSAMVATTTNKLYWNTSTNLSVAWSNLANNTEVIISGGNHVVTPSRYLNNGLGAINVYNKTNIFVKLDDNATINGSSALGELLVMTNCDNVIIRGGTWRGRVVTNWWEADISHVWYGILLHNNQNLWLDGLRLENHMNHGIGGLGNQTGYSAGNTNNIWLTRIKGSYIGSYRTNAATAVDGTFIVPDGPWNLVELEGYANMREVEPYSEGDAAPNRWDGGMLINSRFINTLDRAVLSASSTNNHHFLIAGNYFYREPGFTRNGSNYTATADYIWWNGGYGWTIRGNTFGGHAARAVYITSNVRNGIVEDNKFVNLTNTLGASGHAIQIDEAYNMRVKNNTVIGGEGIPIYLFGTRDSEVTGNWFEDAFGEVGIQIATFGGPVTSNVWFEANTFKGITNAIWDQALSGSENLTFIGNRIEGNTGNAYNLASTTAGEVTIRTYDSHGGTNQLATLGQLNGASNVLYAAIGSGGGGGGAGSLPMNANQFDTNATASIKAGALATNFSARGLTIPQLTTDRALFVNGSGNVTNSPAVSAAELEFLDGVTSAIQTQFGAKMGSTTNGNHFAGGSTLAIKSGALLTNVQARGVTGLGLTVSRVAIINPSGNLTNSPAVDTTEIEYLDGVTSAIQTQLGGKMNGASNANQFGASTTLTIKDGVILTNLQVSGSLTLTGSTAVSLFHLQSYQGDAFAVQRDTNAPASTGTTNKFEFNQAAKAADKIQLLSTSAGVNVWTNGPITLEITDTNQASVNVDFALPYEVYLIRTSRTNFDVAFSNTYAARIGRSVTVEFPTNLVTTSVQVTNKDAQTVRWNFGVTTNGAPSIVKTNIRHMTLMLTTPTTNHPVVDMGNY